MSLAYFAFYPNDFIGATCHLTNEQTGAYMKILCFLWQKQRSKESYLKAVGFGSVSIGLSEWEPVAELLQIDENGLLYNRRLEEERKKAEKKHEAQVNNGKKGGRPKKVNPKANPKQKIIESQNKPIANPSANPIKSNHNHNHNHINNKDKSVGSLEVYEAIKQNTHTDQELSFSSNFPKDAEEVCDHGFIRCGKFKPFPERCIEFYEFWEASGWRDSNGNQINWKNKLIHFLRDYKETSQKSNASEMDDICADIVSDLGGVPHAIN